MSGGLVAVAFSDVVSSTELWSRLGDARADEVRRRLRAASDEAVAAVGGSVVKDLGDGVMATFPTGSASLDGAVAMQQACASVARATGVADLQLRVGVSIGEATREGDDWFGVPVVEASRLCAAAEPGQVLVVDSVLLLARRTTHTTRSIGLIALKGLPDSVAASEVEWAPSADSDVELPTFLRRHEGDLPFTGRDAALAQLRDALARPSERRLVVVSGEPGVGKTRLMAEFAAEAAAGGALVLAVVYEEGVDVYHRTLARALRLLHERCEPPAHVREIVALLGIGGAMPSRPIDVDATMVGDALGEWIAAAAATQPVVVISDDMHWASEQSLNALRALVSTVGDAPVLAVGTYRDTDLDRSHPLAGWLAAQRRDTPPLRIDLHGLDLYDTIALLSAKVGRSLDNEMLRLAEELHRETEGNAFFLGQMIDHLVETGAVIDHNGEWRLAVGIDQLGLPQGVREVVGRRLELLPQGADEVLAVAAVQGREFSIAVTRAAVELEMEQVVDALDALENAGLVRADPSSVDRLSFVHALVRETVLDELATLRRSRLHLRVASALDAAHPEPERAMALAMVDHYTEAAALGGLPRAVDLLPETFRDQGRDASGLDLADILRASRRMLDAARDVGLDDRRLVTLHRTVAQTAFLVEGDRVQTRTSFLEAVRLAERVGDPELFALAVTVGSNAAGFGLDPLFLSLAPQALAGIDPRSLPAAGLRSALVGAHSFFAPPGVDVAADYLQLVADFPDERFFGAPFALHCSPDIERALQELGNGPVSWSVFHMYTLARVDLSRTRRHLADVAPIVDRSRTQSMRAAHWQGQALVAMALGEFDEASACIDGVEREAGGEAMFAVGVPWQRFRLARWRGEHDEERRCWQRCSAMSPYPRANAAIDGLVLATAGDLDAAHQRFDIAWADGCGSVARDWTYTGLLGSLAELAVVLDRRQEAAEIDAALAPFDGQFLLEACIGLLGSVAWFRGGLARLRGDMAAAERHYERALEFETAQGAAPMAARTAADLAVLRTSR